MARSARDAGDRGWIWLLRVVGLLLAMAILSNVAEVVGTLGGAASGPGDSARAPRVTAGAPGDGRVPGVYHVECVEFRPSLPARFRHVVRRMLPARLVASAAELPACRRCGERIESGSQIWIAGSPDARGR